LADWQDDSEAAGLRFSSLLAGWRRFRHVELLNFFTEAMIETPEGIPLDRLIGLRPEIWLSVGSGFAREDVKALILSQGYGFIGESITTLQEICLKIIGGVSDPVLSSSARQEVLRTLLADPRIINRMTELKRIKRQRHFVRRLDACFQSARLAFAHPLEEEVYDERLKQILGENPLRVELRGLAQAYQVWCEVSSCMDLPMLISKATQILREGWPDHLSQPQEIWSLSVPNPESLEREFWEVLGQSVVVKQVRQMVEPRAVDDRFSSRPQVDWQKWHTLDDAAEYFADQLSHLSPESDWSQNAILIPDIPAIRRSLRRALESRGIPLADPRDPTRLRWDELVKWALLPLEVVGRNFERQRVISWLRNFQMQDEFSAWVGEINSRGIRNGLSSYAGGMLSGVHSRLSELATILGGRKTCQELADAHIRLLRTYRGHESKYSELISFFEHTWKSFQSDLTRVGQAEKKAPTLYWVERFQYRLSEASPPVERLKPRFGIQLYRLQQAPVKAAPRVWVFGMPPHWLNGDGAGDYWFSDRDRDILASEFAIRSSTQVREERIRALQSWFAGAQEITLLDAQYEVDGRERESILPVLQELMSNSAFAVPDFAQELGSHPRFTPSYRVLRPVQPQEIQLSPMRFRGGGMTPELTATALDRYSRCSFQGLIYHRWNLRDIREPDTELWPDVRGNILHESVRLLLGSVDEEGNFLLSPEEALNRAWRVKRPKGLMKSERVERYVKARMCLVLRAFCEKERDYLHRSGAQPMSLEESSFRLDYKDFSVIGQPDRIDRFKDGLFIIDYKTSGSVPHGVDMVEQGYRLQLPFYALAANKELNLPVFGVQFVEMDRKGSRKSGIFFKDFNGKGPGTLTHARSNSKSLLSIQPDEAWNSLENHLVSDGTAFVEGRFQAKPKVAPREKECGMCMLGDLCGYRRWIDPS
jgi:hypothetical protein